MRAAHDGAARGALVRHAVGRGKGRSQRLIRQGQRRGGNGGDAVPGTVARHADIVVPIAVGVIRAGVAVRVDIEQAGDDIGAVQIDGVRARLAQHTREAAVFHGEGPVLKAEFLRIDHCILKLHGISPSVRAQALFAQLRQTGRRHGLADAARFFIRQHDAHLLRKLRIFLVQDGQAGLENDAAAEAGHDAAEHDHVVHVVEAAVQLQRMGQICADGSEDPAGATVTLLHEVLHDLELFSGRERGIQLDAGARRELDDGILREILAADADVRGPLVRHGVLKEVDRRKGQLVKPAEHLALGVDIADGLGRTHSHAHNGAALQAHGPGQRRHVAVVRHDDRHIADLSGRAVIDRLDKLALSRGPSGTARRPSGCCR